jgi:hypothetical protein
MTLMPLTPSSSLQKRRRKSPARCERIRESDSERERDSKGEKAGVLSYLQRKLLFTLHRKLLLTYQLDMVDLAYSLTLACQNSV